LERVQRAYLAPDGPQQRRRFLGAADDDAQVQVGVLGVGDEELGAGAVFRLRKRVSFTTQTTS